ncbi:AAA family ATPase [Ferroacidibacillus organovorans]|uniref:AAA family ATPase n=2 Tax=Ferroacidibacillus organovorans TaxID=1765683 RepID=UPI001FCF8D4E|nr:AAA family ATPase [Ferroacidibacillus organovorans]
MTRIVLSRNERSGRAWPDDAYERVEDARDLVRRRSDPRAVSQKPPVADVDKNALLEPLHRLIGLSEVKAMIEELYAYALIQNKRRVHQLRSDSSVWHMVFTGKPGTGKTTVARILGQMFAALGVLSKGHLVEAERADLVGEYIGHTAQKTRTLLDRAQGGILFLDEAYSLSRGGEKDFGREAIDTLVKGLEDRKDDLVVILAGYSQEMNDFLAINPGLCSRFPHHIAFPDFSESELMQIAVRMLETREYALSPDAYIRLRHALRRSRESLTFSNGRTVRNMLDRAIRRHALRVVEERDPSREMLMTLCANDLRDVDREDRARGDKARDILQSVVH